MSLPIFWLWTLTWCICWYNFIRITQNVHYLLREMGTQLTSINYSYMELNIHYINLWVIQTPKVVHTHTNTETNAKISIGREHGTRSIGSHIVSAAAFFRRDKPLRRERGKLAIPFRCSNCQCTVLLPPKNKLLAWSVLRACIMAGKRRGKKRKEQETKEASPVGEIDGTATCTGRETSQDQMRVRV